jgi:NAD(P)-dependent dehydrogenase (short-subunit alcohol dehydrogenase family)
MEEKRIVVTGGFGALGSAVAHSCAARGARVARLDQSPGPVDRVEGVMDLASLNLADITACLSAVETVESTLGGIDVLINIAGGFSWESLEDGSVATWQNMFTTNVLTTVAMTKAALPTIKRSRAGRIINIGASSALSGTYGMGAYAASKSSVHRMTESLAAELVDTTVTVNALLPGVIDTPSNRASMPDANIRNWVAPSAIADVILFLVSDAGRSISGALIPVIRGSDSSGSA